jgi:hypothetical protein
VLNLQHAVLVFCADALPVSLPARNFGVKASVPPYRQGTSEQKLPFLLAGKETGSVAIEFSLKFRIHGNELLVIPFAANKNGRNPSELPSREGKQEGFLP